MKNIKIIKILHPTICYRYFLHVSHFVLRKAEEADNSKWKWAKFVLHLKHSYYKKYKKSSLNTHQNCTVQFIFCTRQDTGHDICLRTISTQVSQTRMSPYWILLELRMIEVAVTTGATCLDSSGDWDTVRTNWDGLSEEPGFNSRDGR